MNVTQLPLEQQETASYCHSCLELRSEDELGVCLQCGYRICGMDGCSSRCACDDAATELSAQIDYALEMIKGRIERGECIPPVVPAPGVLEAIMQDIDHALASANSVPA